MHVPLGVTLAPVLIVNETVTDGVNPEPVTVTWVPLGPWTGVKETVGIGDVIVNWASALSNPPADESEPYAVTV